MTPGLEYTFLGTRHGFSEATSVYLSHQKGIFKAWRHIKTDIINVEASRSFFYLEYPFYLRDSFSFMRTVAIDINIEYLLYYLEDELKEFTDLRIHPVAPSGTKKSPDLPQDYDPKENSIHLQHGVRIRAGSREFFFPSSWVKENKIELIREQAQEVREYCHSKFK